MAGIIVRSRRSMLFMPRSMATLVAVQTAKPPITSRIALLRAAPSSLLLTSLSRPAATACQARRATKTASRTTTTTASGSTEDMGTQTGSKRGREKPTKTMPTTKRPASSNCRTICCMPDLEPPLMAHSRYCSTKTLAIWSKKVVKMMPTWHAVAAVVSKTVVIKSIWAHRAALRRNVMRTSLRPSRNTAEPWPLIYRKRAAEAELTTMPLFSLRRQQFTSCLSAFSPPLSLPRPVLAAEGREH